MDKIEPNVKLTYYCNYCIDCTQILHMNKDHLVLFVVGPNTPQTNPRWRTAATLKNKKSRYLR